MFVAIFLVAIIIHAISDPDVFYLILENILGDR
jgi:hypothetical protein